jgi:plastocyanin
MSSARLAALAAVALAAACRAPSAPPKPKTLTVAMKAMEYAPTQLAAHVGDTVVWTNQDIVRHSITAKDGRFDFDLDPSQSRSTVLDRSGRVLITCRYHPTMTMQLDVEP